MASATTPSAHPRIIDPDGLAEAARAAGEATIECDTGLALVDVDIDTAAAFLAPRDWRERASWLNAITVASLESMVKLLDAYCRDDSDHRPYIAACTRDMRASIGLILARLEEIAPRPKTASAMPLFRLSHDERHVRAARAWFDDEAAEARAYEPESGLLVLRNLAIGLDERAGEQPSS